MKINIVDKDGNINSYGRLNFEFLIDSNKVRALGDTIVIEDLYEITISILEEYPNIHIEYYLVKYKYTGYFTLKIDNIEEVSINYLINPKVTLDHIIDIVILSIVGEMKHIKQSYETDNKRVS